MTHVSMKTFIKIWGKTTQIQHGTCTIPRLNFQHEVYYRQLGVPGAIRLCEFYSSVGLHQRHACYCKAAGCPPPS